MPNGFCRFVYGEHQSAEIVPLESPEVSAAPPQRIAMQGLRGDRSARTDSEMTAVSEETAVSMCPGIADAAFVATGANADTLLLTQAVAMLRALEEDADADSDSDSESVLRRVCTVTYAAALAVILQRHNRRELGVAHALWRRMHGGESGIARNIVGNGLPVEFNLLRAMREARREGGGGSKGESGSESESDGNEGDEDEAMGEGEYEDG